MSEDEDAKLAILAVGDDDQNIYAFNKTSTRFIRQFEQDYNAKRQVLGTNYRSTPRIVTATQKLIVRNTDRMKDDHALVSARKEPGEPVTIRQLEDPEDAPLAALAWLEQHRPATEAGWNDLAVLARKNETLHTLRAACEARGIPVRHAMNMEGMPRLLHIREITRALDHLRGLDHQTVNRDDLLYWLEQAHQGQPTRWDTLLRQQVTDLWEDQSGPMPASAARESLIENLAEAHRDLTLGNGVFLATAFKAKGLEFQKVLVLDDWAGQAREGSPQEEDERRVFYVGLTRAKDTLDVLASPAHPFAKELTADTATREQPAASVPGPRPAACMYALLGMKDINLGWAGQKDAKSPIHAALGSLKAGDAVRLVALEGQGVVIQNMEGRAIGLLSRAGDEKWRERLAELSEVRVMAVVRRTKAMEKGMTGRREAVVEDWEAAVMEGRTVVAQE